MHIYDWNFSRMHVRTHRARTAHINAVSHKINRQYLLLIELNFEHLNLSKWVFRRVQLKTFYVLFPQPPICIRCRCFFSLSQNAKKMHFVRFAIFLKMILFKNHKRPPYSFVFSAFFWNISFLFRAFVRSLWKQFGNGIASTFIPIHTQRERKEERNNFHQKQTTTTKKK